MAFNKRRLMIGGALATVAAAVLGAGVLYFTLVPGDAPDQASLSGAVAAVNAGSNLAATPQASESLAGEWTLAATGDSFVGYRVREELASIGTFTAVGRTTNLTATLAFDGSTITGVQVTADVASLRSDNSMRDATLKRQALESSVYPTATFTLTQPIALGRTPTAGEPISATAVGDLTLHGVTRSVALPLQGQLTNGYVVVVGSLDIAFADFNIATPSSAAVLGVEDRGLLELQLVFQRGTAG